jgi:hypothetical protein
MKILTDAAYNRLKKADKAKYLEALDRLDEENTNLRDELWVKVRKLEKKYVDRNIWIYCLKSKVTGKIDRVQVEVGRIVIYVKPDRVEHAIVELDKILTESQKAADNIK